MQTNINSTEVQTTLHYNSLSYLQKEKFDYLKPMINDEDVTLRLVTLLEGRGRNNFNSVIERFSYVNNSKDEERIYYDALYDKFKVGSIYTPSDIIGIVSQVRTEIKLPPYTSDWKHKCVNDFLSLFIVHDIYEEIEIDDKTSKKHRGYTPKLKLKLES